MGEQPNAALQATLDALAATLKSLQTSVDANSQAIKRLSEERSSWSSSSKSGTGEHHQDRPPRFQKLDFPRYDGKSDPLIFINRCESYFHQQRIMEEEKVWMASYNLEEGAQMWYIQVQEDKGIPSWHRVKDLLHLRYGPPLRSNPLHELAACKRTGTVADYQDRFQVLLPRAGRLDEEQRVQLFTGGLQPPLSLDVEVHNPQTLAVRYEPRSQAGVAGAVRGTGPASCDKGPAGHAWHCLHHRGPTLLTRTPSPWRVGRSSRLFLLDGAVEDAEDLSESSESAVADKESPLFSLHTIAGVRFTDTMQLGVDLGGTPLIVLLDSGSTHNFIFESAAQRTGLPLQRRPCLTATVVNDERVSCVGVIRRAAVTIHGDLFHADLFVMPLTGYDMVLGTQWLAALGPVLWDFGARTMTFQWQGQSVCWQGVPGPEATTVRTTTTTTTLLDELLASFDDIFAEPHGLPPIRSWDHGITLVPGSQPVMVRPYRYPATHKDKLER
ncbi:uncharacterized protein [Miscanthus floridulus]|uniref:uncharacterized protein n=1 Tax=Miscanthus floridulus TaxID=154761 RepID=UPI00345A48AF